MKKGSLVIALAGQRTAGCDSERRKLASFGYSVLAHERYE